MKGLVTKFGTVLIGIILIAACSKNPSTPEYQKEVTVFGYLWGNRSLDSTHAILVAYTRPLLDFYELQQAAIRNADVSLTEENTGRVIVLSDSPAKPGFYYNDSLMIKPNATYHLRVEAEGRTVTASTTVPPVLHLTTDLRTDTVNAVHPQNISRQMPVFLDGENPDQIVMVDMYCNESWQNAEYINAFFGEDKPADRQSYDGGADREPRHIRGLARMRELASDNFPGRLVIDWYSSMIVFYGSNTMQILAIDDNYHNFIYREHPELSGGIEGGIGVFGSVCGETYRLQVLKP